MTLILKLERFARAFHEHIRPIYFPVAAVARVAWSGSSRGVKLSGLIGPVSEKT